ncbi:MAG TPA: hypothetical protein VHM48_14145, partial [Candidatus Limnocylindrales bacterium]|nr:hypothetical protein [Candidatus Limnocylindrales bacterium]
GPAPSSAGPDGPVLGKAVFEDGDGTHDAAVEPQPAGLSVDAADLELALRYVPDYRVLVLAADLDPPALDAVVAAAGWSGAHLVALIPDGASTPALPETTTVLLRPPTDPDGAFASMVAAYAVALDQGSEPAAAFATAQQAGGWAAVAD